jgi:HK97 family phage portal protein
MSFLQRVQTGLFRHSARADGRGPLSDFWYQPIGGYSSAGVRVTDGVAQTVAAFWQGCRLISQGIGGLPCHLYERLDKDRRQRVTGSTPVGNLAYRLRWQPNQIQTAIGFWGLTAMCTQVRGMFVAEKQPGPFTGGSDNLVPIHPDLVTRKRLPAGTLRYDVRDGGATRHLSPDDVFVVDGATDWDGVTPMPLIRYAAQSLGTTIAADRYAGRFFKSGTANAMAVISKDELGPEGIQNLHASVTKYISGLENAFGVLPLEGDVDIKTIGVSPHDAQLILARQFGVEDVARWLNIPLHMLRFSNAGTGSYSSLEVFSAEFVTYTLRPIAIAIEQAIQRDLLIDPLDDRDYGDPRRDRYFAEFNVDALMRGDLTSRYSAYRTGIMSGFLRRNEARVKENLDPADGLDEFLTPMNMNDGAASNQFTDPATSRASGDGPTYERYRASVLAAEAAGRIVRKERAAVEKLAKQYADDPDGWEQGLRAFYADHAGFISETLRVPYDTAREYCGRQGCALLKAGVSALDALDFRATEDLAVLALSGGSWADAA